MKITKAKFIFKFGKHSSSLKTKLKICRSCKKEFQYNDIIYSSHGMRYHKKCAESLNVEVNN
jgi:hypothetical protein